MKPDLRLIDVVPVPAYTLRLESDEFVLQGVNAAALKRNSEILLLRGKPLASLYRDHPEVIEDARRCIREQVVVEREHQVRRYDRTEATQHLRLTFVPTGAEYMVLFLQDVADPDMMQTALREGEARYRTLMASLPDAVLMLGADGRVLYCNEHAVALFGATSTGSLVGESAVLPPGMQVQAESGAAIACDELPCWQVLATGQPEIGGVFAFKGERGVRWARIAAQPILGARGEVKGSISILTDFTERMNAQAALSDSAARLDLTLAEARMGVWEFEVGKAEGWWSPTLAEVFKVVSDSSLEKLLEQVHPDDRASVLALVQALTERKHGDEFLHECRIIGADNVTRHARIRGRIPCDASGRKLLRGTVTDITEQRTLEEELRRANRLESIGRLAGGVAHDFNNLLAAMLGSLEMVDEVCPETAQPDLATIRDSIMRARDLTRQLLAFARKQPVERRIVDLVTLVASAKTVLRRLIGPEIEIVIDTVSRALIRADPSLIEQVLVNLVVNAREAMPKGGRLEIRVTTRDGTAENESGVAVLSVADSGIGMDEDVRRHAFDPFFTTKSLGTGLGLASSYGIVRQHQGQIDVESKPGEGAVFRVTLPLARDSIPAVAQGTETNERPPLAGLLMVVDDESSVREAVARMARSLGYEVVVASNGQEATRMLEVQQARLALLMCDIAMPGEDGPSVVQRLRKMQPELRVLFMSGYSPDLREVCLPRSLFIQKPFSLKEMTERLAELVKGG